MIDFKSTFKIALRSLQINKMRSILTSLGIIIGVSAVIIMLSVGEGAKGKISKDIASIGSNILMVMSSSTNAGGIKGAMGSQPTLTLKDAEAILEKCPSVIEVAPIVAQSEQVIFSNQNWSTSVNGVTPGYMRSEEHTSELQSPDQLVCRLLREKKNKSVYRASNAVAVCVRYLIILVGLNC